MELKAQTVVRQRRIPPPGLGAMLRRARIRRSLGQKEAGRLAGLSQGYLCHLEHGRRLPSMVVAEALACVLQLTEAERQQLYGAAVTDAGRCHPARLGQAA
jgi:transcriptional regulator with XRE-family HTH domain